MIEFIPYVCSLDIWNQTRAILGLAALAQDTRLEVFRLLVSREPDGLAAGDIARYSPSRTTPCPRILACLRERA